jgi:hypothetical protein
VSGADVTNAADEVRRELSSLLSFAEDLIRAAWREGFQDGVNSVGPTIAARRAAWIESKTREVIEQGLES